MNTLLRITTASLLLAALGTGNASQLTAMIVDNTGKPLPDAVMYLAPKLATAPLPAARPAVIDQINKEFVPRISIVQTGSAVTFPNRDNIRHQVYSFSPAKVFQLKLYSGTPSEPVVMDKSGVIVLGCNIHDHMVGWVLSVDTAWFGQANDKGVATVASVPAGQYELMAWYPGIDKPVALGEIKLDGTNTIDRSIRLEVKAVVGDNGAESMQHRHAGS